MKKHIADRWVAALRSGQYKQAHNTLRLKVGEETSFCCLGVLCDLVKDEPEIEGIWNGAHFEAGDRSEGVLPFSVQTFAGMSTDYGELGPELQPLESDEPATALTDLNDRGKTFEEIAALIEEHWQIL